MGRRYITQRNDNLADGDLVPINHGDSGNILALAVGSTSEPGSYLVRASNMLPFILDNHHPFIGEGNMALVPPISITPNWVQLSTPGFARGCAVDVMLYSQVPNWLPRGRAVLETTTDPDGESELSRSIIVQGRKRVVVQARLGASGAYTVHYAWASLDFPLMFGDYPFTDAVGSGTCSVREISTGEGIAGAGEAISGLSDILTVSITVAGEGGPVAAPGYFVIEAYDD